MKRGEEVTQQAEQEVLTIKESLGPPPELASPKSDSDYDFGSESDSQRTISVRDPRFLIEHWMWSEARGRFIFGFDLAQY